MVKGKSNIKKIIGIVILIILVIGGVIAFKMAQDNKPVKVKLELGETLEFLCGNKNDGEILIKIPEGVDTKYDSISYYKPGECVYASKDLFRNKQWGIGEQMYEVKFTLTQGEYLEFTMPKKFEKYIEITKEPIFTTVSLNKGESVEVINSSKNGINIKMQVEEGTEKGGDYLKVFDYITYDKNGDVSKLAGDCNESFVYASKGEKLILTNKINENLNLYVPIECVDYVVKVDKSGVVEVEVSNQEMLEIENPTEIHHIAQVVFEGYDPYKQNDEESFRYMIITDNNGEEITEKVYTQPLKMSPNTKVKIMPSTEDKSIKVYLPSDLEAYYKK